MKQVTMPDISTTQGTVVIRKWLRREGEHVKRGDPLVEVETDKTNVEIEAHAEGTLVKILVDEGAQVAVGATIAYIGTPGEVPAREAAPKSLAEPRRSSRGPRKAFPLAEKLAMELGVDLEDVHGTGPGGMITPADVRKAAERELKPAP